MNDASDTPNGETATQPEAEPKAEPARKLPTMGDLITMLVPMLPGGKTIDARLTRIEAMVVLGLLDRMGILSAAWSGAVATAHAAGHVPAMITIVCGG